MAAEPTTASHEAGVAVVADGPPPRENLVRALDTTIELVRSDDDAMPTMVGHFAVFNEWTEIRSRFEGRFLERVAGGAFKKTFQENRDRIRVVFAHGLDPQIGDKVLGPIARLEEDDLGAAYEVPLLDTSYNRDLLPGIEAGLYGASFRFGVMRENFVQRPRRAEHNPEGLPERTVLEARVREFGPCTFPAYTGATAGLRSVTDEWMRACLIGDELVEPRGHATIAVPRALEPTREDEERAERLYSRTIETAASTPWAMEPGALATVLTIISERAAGKRLTDEEIRERIGTRQEGDPVPASSPVAVLRLRGPIVPHAGMMSATSAKLASVEELRDQFRQALASEDVKAILFDIDSPGGSGSLIPEFGSEIRAARGGDKPIVAIANTNAASAAYWLASQADELVVTPSGMVGSIGVYVAHDDISGLQEKAGVKTTLVSAGKYKTEGSPFEPLTEEAKAELQAFVDEFYDMFLGAVAKGRGVSPAKVRDDFGQGRMVTPAKALEAGMVDSVATFDETLARLTKAATVARTSSEEPEPPAATTPTPVEPEPSEATTRAPQRDLFWFARPSNEGAQ